MKNFFLYSILISSFVASCQVGGSHSDSDSNSAEAKKNISKRDYSINKSNSYSDLFLDSTAMEKFIASKKLPDSVANRMRSFYNTRNYQFAWFNSNGMSEQTYAFWNLHDYVTTYDNDTSLRDKKLQKKMDALTAEENLSPSASADYINTELTLTEHFIKYVLNNYDKGYVKRKEMERFIPFKKEDALATADSILNKKHKDDKYFENVNAPYKGLKDQLGKYYSIAKAGGWPQITAKKTLKKGVSDPSIPIIKKRLAITGEMVGKDSSQVFNDTLENAVKIFQTTMGYKPDGVITAQLIKDMNVPATERLKQILLNMGRMRWMPTEPDGRLIIVNIPEFVLHVYENKKKAWDMNVVVGKEGHNTTMFTGDLNQVVFSPYWNVPPSIVQKEILPKMASNPDYLANQHMEQTGTDENGVPKIRQLPGENNSLGKVKFLFPNSFNIYFHDTNAKDLFSRDKRAFSHGCIRLSEPEKMAQYLLRDQPEWTTEKIEEAMNSGNEKYVRLKNPVPVIITYYTAWVDDNGRINFRDDIYSHDQTLGSKMFVGGY